MQGKDSKALYPIGIAEQLTGLTARQIRYYEANGLLAPQRTVGRQRLYSGVDVDRLKEVKSLMGRGLTLAQVREHLQRRAGRENARDGGAGGADPLMAEAPPTLTRDMRLTSLYPVSNRAVLMRLLDDEGKGKGYKTGPRA